MRFDHLRAAVVASAGAAFVVGTFALLLAPLLRDVAASLRAPVASVGAVPSVYGLSMGTTALAAAMLHRTLGVRPMMLLGGTAHVAALIVMASAASWIWLLVAYAVGGAGAGLALPGFVSAVGSLAGPERKAEALGQVNAGWALATLAGVPAASLAARSVGWRMIPVGLAVLWVPTLIVAARIRVDAPTAIAAVGGLPIRVVQIVGATFGLFFGFYGAYAFLGSVLRDHVGGDATGPGLVVLCYGAGFLAGTLNARQYDRYGPATSFIAALALQTVVLLVLPVAATSIATACAVACLWGVTQNAAFTSVTAWLSALPAHLRGRALALNQAALSFGFCGGTATAAGLMGRGGYSAVCAAAATATALAALIAVAARREPSAADS
jgi:DHA1 family inner membrane transport protein